MLCVRRLKTSQVKSSYLVCLLNSSCYNDWCRGAQRVPIDVLWYRSSAATGTVTSSRSLCRDCSEWRFERQCSHLELPSWQARIQASCATDRRRLFFSRLMHFFFNWNLFYSEISLSAFTERRVFYSESLRTGWDSSTVHFPVMVTWSSPTTVPFWPLRFDTLLPFVVPYELQYGVW